VIVLSKNGARVLTFHTLLFEHTRHLIKKK